MTHDKIAAVYAAHGIELTYVETVDGPQVHRHRFALPLAIRVAKAVGLHAEVEMALGVEGVSILRDGAYLAVDVPRADRLFVDWEGLGTQGLEFFAGLDLAGKVRRVDLATAPHLLIAGSTGSGKSVAINAVITDWLTRLGPDEIRLHLVDPKRVELGHWAAFPQVEQFVPGGGSMALGAITTVETIMDQRFDRFERAGVRDIGEYNSAHPDETMPYQVLIVDEFADLMLADKAVSREIETAIVRIAQLGRAAGVHLMLATQRPSHQVFTGLIKANVPARWVFRVNTGTDSRIALDEMGAEDLLGAGDSLLQWPGERSVTRLQAAAATADQRATALSLSREKWPDVDHEPPHSLEGSADGEPVSLDDVDGPGEPTKPWPVDPYLATPEAQALTDEEFEAYMADVDKITHTHLEQSGATA